MRRPPHGGRRVECANCEMRSAVAMECISERVSEQFSCERRSEIRQKRITLLRRRVFRDVRAPCVAHHMAVNA
eukprot:11187478-Lingulodinium_polyedra.AAC.1